MARRDGRIDQLLVGYPLSDDGLVYAGRVELGLTRSYRQALAPHLEQLACEVSPFGFRLTGAHWVEPQLEVLVDHGPPTASGRLREPLFAGLLLPTWRSALRSSIAG